MPFCLCYCHVASKLDPKPFKRVIAFWFSSTKKKYLDENLGHLEANSIDRAIYRHAGHIAACCSWRVFFDLEND